MRCAGPFPFPDILAQHGVFRSDNGLDVTDYCFVSSASSSSPANAPRVNTNTKFKSRRTGRVVRGQYQLLCHMLEQFPVCLIAAQSNVRKNFDETVHTQEEHLRFQRQN